jgi:uncharacterized membrane protein YeaQ/YmgE (transglycosylase-associated protein family)
MTVGQILGWLLAGLIVGVLARLLVPGKQDMGVVMTIVLGVVGALIGGVLYNLIAHGEVAPAGGFDVGRAWPGWIFSVIGGVVVLALYIMATGRRSTQA